MKTKRKLTIDQIWEQFHKTSDHYFRNLLMEKYALMEGMIKSVNPEAHQLIDKIVERECKWVEELQQKYPNVKMARPIYSSEDRPGAVSSETYSRGELETYSMRTLELYHQDNLDMESEGKNRIEMAMRLMSQEYSKLSPNE